MLGSAVAVDIIPVVCIPTMFVGGTCVTVVCGSVVVVCISVVVVGIFVVVAGTFVVVVSTPMFVAGSSVVVF